VAAGSLACEGVFSERVKATYDYVRW